MWKSNRTGMICWALIAVLLQEGWLFSERGEAQERAASVSIADEPKYIDPITLVPEPLRAKLTHTFQETPLTEVATWIQSQMGPIRGSLLAVWERLQYSGMYFSFDNFLVPIGRLSRFWRRCVVLLDESGLMNRELTSN